MTTGGSVGASLGSSVAGVVLDAGGPALGLMMPFIFTGCAVPLAFVGWLMARRRAMRMSPTADV